MTPLLRAVPLLLAVAVGAAACAPASPADTNLAGDSLTLERALGSGPGEWRADRRVWVGADGRVEVTRHHWRVDYRKRTVRDSAPTTAALRVAPARARALLARAGGSGFFALDTAAYVPQAPGCRAYSTDQTSYRLTVRWRGRTRTVKFYEGCIDERRWSPASEARGAAAAGGAYVRPGPPPVVAALLALAAATDSLAVYGDPGR